MNECSWHSSHKAVSMPCAVHSCLPIIQQCSVSDWWKTTLIWLQTWKDDAKCPDAWAYCSLQSKALMEEWMRRWWRTQLTTQNEKKVVFPLTSDGYWRVLVLFPRIWDIRDFCRSPHWKMTQSNPTVASHSGNNVLALLGTSDFTVNGFIFPQYKEAALKTDGGESGLSQSKQSPFFTKSIRHTNSQLKVIR